MKSLGLVVALSVIFINALCWVDHNHAHIGAQCASYEYSVRPPARLTVTTCWGQDRSQDYSDSSLFSTVGNHSCTDDISA